MQHHTWGLLYENDEGAEELGGARWHKGLASHRHLVGTRPQARGATRPDDNRRHRACGESAVTGATVMCHAHVRKLTRVRGHGACGPGPFKIFKKFFRIISKAPNWKMQNITFLQSQIFHTWLGLFVPTSKSIWILNYKI
jgi:hypothetical protein